MDRNNLNFSLHNHFGNARFYVGLILLQFLGWL